jgi:CRISPR/Cas system-associated protein endoribonuclease Cas2
MNNSLTMTTVGAATQLGMRTFRDTLIETGMDMLEVSSAIEAVLKVQDLDRSKVLRRALEEKLAKEGR